MFNLTIQARHSVWLDVYIIFSVAGTTYIFLIEVATPIILICITFSALLMAASSLLLHPAESHYLTIDDSARITQHDFGETGLPLQISAKSRVAPWFIYLHMTNVIQQKSICCWVLKYTTPDSTFRRLSRMVRQIQKQS